MFLENYPENIRECAVVWRSQPFGRRARLASHYADPAYSSNREETMLGEEKRRVVADVPCVVRAQTPASVPDVAFSGPRSLSGAAQPST